MKRLLIATELALLVSIIISCKPKVGTDTTSTQDSTNVKSKVNTLPKAALTYPKNVFTLNGIPYGSADAMINSFLINKGSYDQTHPTCIWFSKEALKVMLSTLTLTTNSDGIRFYFARTVPYGDYTGVAVSTTDGGVDSADPTPDPLKKRHIHNDYFQNALPVLTSGASLTNIYGQIGDVTPVKGAKLYGGSPCGTAIQCPGASTHYITCADAYNMVSYVGNDEINATSEWFDKGVIQSLIDATPDGGGIRIYYARHLKAYDPVDTATKRHGFVIITTYADPNGVQQDQYVCINISAASPYIKLKPKGSGGGADNGEECPTNCSGTNWP